MNNLIIIPEQALPLNAFNSFISYLDASPKTIETYTRALRQFMCFLSNNNITKPMREDVLRFREQLKENLKPATVQSYLIVVRLFFRWTENLGLYPNIADKIKGAKLNREHKKDYLTSEQVKLVLNKIEQNTLKGLRDYAMLSVMITGGLRTIEIVRANVSDIRANGNNTVLYIQGKGQEEKTEYIILQPPVEAALRKYLSECKTAEKTPLFKSVSNQNYGQRLTVRSVSGIVKEKLINAGFNSETLTAHSLRHTAVTLSLLGGLSLEEVQQFARHVNISTTQIYAHNLDRANNKCEEVISKAIF